MSLKWSLIFAFFIYCLLAGCKNSGSELKDQPPTQTNKHEKVNSTQVDPANATQLYNFYTNEIEVNLQIENPVGGLLGLQLTNQQNETIFAGYNANEKEYFLDTKKIRSTIHKDLLRKPLFKDEGVLNIKLELKEDRIEMSADDGQTFMSLPLPRDLVLNQIQLVGNVNKGSVISYTITQFN
jgi:hypothetical protein